MIIEFTTDGSVCCDATHPQYSGFEIQISEDAGSYLGDVSASGKLGIGTATPSVPLEVKGKAIIDGELQLGIHTADVMGEGPRLNFLGPYSNTDHLWISRYNRVSDITDLRVNMGDNPTQDDRFVIGTTTANDFHPHFVVSNLGRVGIGKENPTQALEVNGTILAKEVNITLTGWSDFVFAPNYQLPTLNEVQRHIDEHQHLPGIPSEAEVKENGVNMGEMQAKLLQKIEELTLYLIRQDNTIQELKSEIRELKEK
jgi:hypothetical protein